MSITVHLHVLENIAHELKEDVHKPLVGGLIALIMVQGLFWVASFWVNEWFTLFHVLASAVGIFFMGVSLLWKWILIRKKRFVQANINKIAKQYDRTDWQIASEEDVAWAMCVEWNAQWTIVSQSLQDKNNLFYIEAGEPSLKDVECIKNYYYWLCHREELIMQEGVHKEECTIVW